MRELLDMATLEATIHQNGVVTTRKYLKTNEDTVRRFLRAYIEGGTLAKKDKAFAIRVMAQVSRHQRPRDSRRRLRARHPPPRDPAVSQRGGSICAAQDLRKSATQSPNGESRRLHRRAVGPGARQERFHRSVVGFRCIRSGRGFELRIGGRHLNRKGCGFVSTKSSDHVVNVRRRVDIDTVG
jgi:hypothetical protein